MMGNERLIPEFGDAVPLTACTTEVNLSYSSSGSGANSTVS